MDTLSRRQSKETASADKRQTLTERGRRLIIEIHQGMIAQGDLVLKMGVRETMSAAMNEKGSERRVETRINLKTGVRSILIALHKLWKE